MAFIYNSLEWSLKYNSDSNVIEGHCQDALRALQRLSPTGRDGGGMRYERKEGLRHYIIVGTLDENFE